MPSVIQLWTANRGLAINIAGEFSFPGADRDDVVQEALIGLWIAAREYDPEQGKFNHFAALVVRRHLVDCLRAARRFKQQPLNLALRALPDPDGEWRDILETLPHLHQVVDVVESREKLRIVLEAIPRLSELQRHCVVGIAAGYDYVDLGPYKQVDNALTKARRKLRRAVEAVSQVPT